MPRGSLTDPQLEDTLFALEPGKLTIYPTQNNTYVYQLIEKQPDRAVEEIAEDDDRSTTS